MELVITFLDSLPTGYLADLVTKLAPGASKTALEAFLNKDDFDAEALFGLAFSLSIQDRKFAMSLVGQMKLRDELLISRLERCTIDMEPKVLLRHIELTIGELKG